MAIGMTYADRFQFSLLVKSVQCYKNNSEADCWCHISPLTFKSNLVFQSLVCHQAKLDSLINLKFSAINLKFLRHSGKERSEGFFLLLVCVCWSGKNLLNKCLYELGICTVRSEYHTWFNMLYYISSRNGIIY